MKTLQSNHVPPRTNNLVWLRGNAASSHPCKSSGSSYEEFPIPDGLVRSSRPTITTNTFTKALSQACQDSTQVVQAHPSTAENNGQQWGSALHHGLTDLLRSRAPPLQAPLQAPPRHPPDATPPSTPRGAPSRQSVRQAYQSAREALWETSQILGVGLRISTFSGWGETYTLRTWPHLPMTNSHRLPLTAADHR